MHSRSMNHPASTPVVASSTARCMHQRLPSPNQSYGVPSTWAIMPARGSGLRIGCCLPPASRLGPLCAGDRQPSRANRSRNHEALRGTRPYLSTSPARAGFSITSSMYMSRKCAIVTSG